MHSPAVLKLQSTTENAIKSLDKGALPQFVKVYIQDAESEICDFYTPRDVIRRYGCGRPQFALSILVGLRDALPECYHTRAFLFEFNVMQGILQVVMSDSSLNDIALQLQTRTRDDFSDGHMFLMVVGSLFKQREQPALQTWINALLAQVFSEIKILSAFLAMRNEVLSCIVNEESSCFPSSSRAATFIKTPGLLLANLRRLAQGLTRSDLLKFKCTLPENDNGSVSKGKKRQAKKNDHACSPHFGPTCRQQSKAQDSFYERKMKRRSKARLLQGKTPTEQFSEGSTILGSTDNADFSHQSFMNTPSSSTSEMLKRGSKSKPPPPKRRRNICAVELQAHDGDKASFPPLPKALGAYPNTLETELRLEIDVLLLVPEKGFHIEAPLISDQNWQSFPVDDATKCEPFLAIGRYILEACVADMVYEQYYKPPLTDEMVIKFLTSDHTLQAVLMKSGVFHQPRTVPVHFPAKAFKVYLGAVFLTETLPFARIQLWLNKIFRPIALSLRDKRAGVGDYQKNRAALVAAGIRIEDLE
ncbi:hypothetical protein C8R44DRAFT_755239 [Mycena epipterygia]|nr:hypothetical protein C8R44DRAFT_755239 [Mycena epipterygia]